MSITLNKNGAPRRLKTKTPDTEILERAHHLPVKRSQAQRIVDKFGGVPALIKALKLAAKETGREALIRNKSSVYRWLLPREKGGTGGLIPTSALPDVLRAAVIEGIYLNEKDIYPGIR
jgi:hypothetical protein